MRSTILAHKAISWYERSARDLPWRHPDTSPWGVLVSEVMLQQTPAARVAPVWSQWLLRWATPAALAADSAGDAIRAWGRLGYPRRAMRLHACAETLVAEHGGDVPTDLDLLLQLPGVGAYTARAVAVFAFAQRHPVVDTNVRRFIARVGAGLADGGTATTMADLIAVEKLLPETPAVAARASIAFMELGALICTARTPQCDQCPLSTECAWRTAGRPEITRSPARRPQGYTGTDRQVRGLLLNVARETLGPVTQGALDSVWPDAIQRDRALASMLADGLLVEVEPGWYGLPVRR